MTDRRPDSGLTLPQILFIACVVVGLLTVGVVTAAKYMVPPPREENIARQAELYLRQRKGAPLSASMDEFLSKPDLHLIASDTHPLLGKPAPDFTLADHLGQPVRLCDLIAQGPVVVIFYYGYWCDHCVAQLFGVHEDIARFRELGARVVAVSADSSKLTKERFEQYGAFAFPTLSDEENKAASLYGCTVKAPDGSMQALHGTFVIGSDGIVHWANTGHQPFLGNPTLLFELAKVEGRLPKDVTSR